MSGSGRRLEARAGGGRGNSAAVVLGGAVWSLKDPEPGQPSLAGGTPSANAEATLEQKVAGASPGEPLEAGGCWGHGLPRNDACPGSGAGGRPQAGCLDPTLQRPARLRCRPPLGCAQGSSPDPRPDARSGESGPRAAGRAVPSPSPPPAVRPGRGGAGGRGAPGAAQRAANVR